MSLQFHSKLIPFVILLLVIADIQLQAQQLTLSAVPSPTQIIASQQQALTSSSVNTTLANQLITSACGQNQVLNFINVCINPIYIEGCQIYQTSTTCNTCQSGYNLSTNTSQCDFNSEYTGVVSTIIGCIQKTSAGVCNVCASNFYLEQGLCKKGVLNCVSYSGNGVCTQCQSDYSLVMAQCRHNALLGCKIQSQTHTCSECYAPFALNSQHCDIDNCLILNDYGCVSCQCGYYLTSNRDCQPMSNGCLRYAKGICSDCLPAYKLKGSVCQIEGCTQYNGNYCSQCSNLYNLEQGECHFKNCKEWLDDSCLACSEGFALQSGICVQETTQVCQ